MNRNKQIPWHTIPFIRLCIPLIIGILLAITFPYTFSYGLVIWLLLLLPLAYPALKPQNFKFRFLFGYLLFIWLIGFGYFFTLIQNEANRPLHFYNLTENPNKVTLVGTVSNTPTLKEYTKVELVVQQILKNDSWEIATGNLLVYVKKDSSVLPLYGQKVIIQADIKPTISSSNPFDFDFKKYLFFHRIYHQTFIEGRGWKVVANNCGNPFFHKLYQWRDFCVEILKKHLTTVNELTVGEALIIGYRDAIPQEIINTYSATGAMHVLSVSGLHVGIIVWILKKFIFRERLFKKRWISSLFNIILIWIFAFMSGGSASVLRAALMFSVILIGQASKRNSNIYNNLGISAFILLIYDPYLIMDVGFQLSYLGLFGIALLQPHVEKLWLIKNKVGWYLWECTVAGLTAQTTTFGITLFRFHQFPTYFWLSGLIVVPAAFAILCTGILLFITSILPLPDCIPYCLGKLLHFFLWCTNNSLFLIQKLPKSLIDGIWISSWQTLFLYLALGAFLLSYFFRAKQWLFAGLILLLSVMTPIPFQSWKQLNQQLLVVHHVRHGCVVDVVSGKKLTSWEIRPTEERSKQFSIKNCRSYLGISQEQTIPKDSIYEDDNIKIQYPFLVFRDKLISVIPSEKADYEILYTTPFKNDSGSLGIRILHPSSSFYLKKQFRNDFKANQINMDTTGTLIFDVSKN